MFFRYSSGDDIIPYSITTVDQNIQLSGVPGFSVGGTYTLNTPYITGRNYGIQFSVADCEYLPQTVTVLDTVAIGTYVYTVSYSDANAADIPYLTIQKNNAPEFTLNSATGKVQNVSLPRS